MRCVSHATALPYEGTGVRLFAKLKCAASRRQRLTLLETAERPACLECGRGLGEVRYKGPDRGSFKWPTVGPFPLSNFLPSSKIVCKKLFYLLLRSRVGDRGGIGYFLRLASSVLRGRTEARSCLTSWKGSVL